MNSLTKLVGLNGAGGAPVGSAAAAAPAPAPARRAPVRRNPRTDGRRPRTGRLDLALAAAGAR